MTSDAMTGTSTGGSSAPQATPGTPMAGASEVREKLALALDFDDSVVAMRMASRLREYFAVAKVGMELFSAAGPGIVAELLDSGFKVFVDLKLADIPNTTRKAARVLGALGASYVTVHSSSGAASVRAAVEGFAEGADRAGLPVGTVLGVTVLTSEAEAPEELLRQRAGLIVEAGCPGLVCAASDLALVRSIAPGVRTVVPGIRLAGTPGHDQGRPSTPAQALADGADLLVVGRTVTEASHPEGAARAVVEDALASAG
ncbi:MAG TPA: orotidine-5'-phosphate decarboxylase [Acidimicrobiales bacterium]|nr:orotidine-5'-phosphate decarboxylase [Acidimicrobiales bacterium]